MSARALVASFATILSISSVGAQPLPVDDSLAAFVGVDSRLLWRAVTLADGAGLEAGISLPLRPILRGLQLELRGWTAIQNRDRFRDGDQYAGSLHYQIPLQRAPGATSLVLLYTEYWTPTNRIAPHHTEEVGLKLLHDFRIPQEGIRTIRTELDAEKDVGRRLTNWIRASAAASLGTTIIKVDSTANTETRHTIQATLIAAISASDLNHSTETAGPEFGFDTGELEFDLEHRLGSPTRSFAISSTLRFGFLSRATRIGPDIGWVGLRESILSF